MSLLKSGGAAVAYSQGQRRHVRRGGAALGGCGEAAQDVVGSIVLQVAVGHRQAAAGVANLQPSRYSSALERGCLLMSLYHAQTRP